MVPPRWGSVGCRHCIAALAPWNRQSNPPMPQRSTPRSGAPPRCPRSPPVKSRTEALSYPGMHVSHPLGGVGDPRGGRATRSIRNGGSRGSGRTVSLPIGFDPNRGKPSGAHTAPSCLRMHVRDGTPWPPAALLTWRATRGLSAVIVLRSVRCIHRHPREGCRWRLEPKGLRQWSQTLRPDSLGRVVAVGSGYPRTEQGKRLCSREDCH